MRGTVAKQIRREIYGKEDPRKRSYFTKERTSKAPFLAQLATLFRKRKIKTLIGPIWADPLRQAYQRLKKQYKEVHHFNGKNT